MEGYVLQINFCTDGDFGCSHKSMRFDGGDTFELYKIWTDENKNKALEETITLLNEIKDTLHGRDYIIEDVKNMINKSIEQIYSQGYCGEEIGGNQDETVISFGYETFDEKESKILVSLTQEEYDMLIEQFNGLRCVVRDTSLNYENYCNGECNSKECNGINVRKSKDFFESRIVDIRKEKKL